MKKIVLSLAGALAATAFAPEASAIPAFARQVGMACTACHFQHFPLLNSFGRAFKNSGFTMIGAQPKVEGEHLSIPATLNISALATAGYETVSNRNQGAANAPNNGKFMMPNGGGELSLFFGGRVSENIGFLSELAFPDGNNLPVGGNALGSSAKMPMLWDVGGSRIGLVVMANNAPAYSFETLSTGAVSTHRLMGRTGANTPMGGGAGVHIEATSASMYLGTKSGGNGVSFVANGEWGFVNIGKYALGGAATLGGTAGNASASNEMNTTYVRGVYTFNAGGWDSAVGVQNFSGHAAVIGAASMDTKATIIDGQMQGELGGMPVGFYASYGRAPASAVGNIYNLGANNTTVLNVLANDRKSFNIAGELGVIPHKATLQLALRSGKNGTGTGLNARGMGDKDNAVMIGGTYELAQNVELSLTHTTNSGSGWNTPATVNAAMTAAGMTAGQAPAGKNVTTFLLEALF